MNRGLRSRRRRRTFDEDVSPLEGAINIVDAMLVFACGLMLALVIRWNVDLAQFDDSVKVTQGEEVTDNADIRSDLIETEGEGQLYQKMGTVYKDPATGKLFMLTDE
ncbi:MAG: DUF2149 domain-containing protein [Syntrophomonas sp.]|nr:DUF2149 domain-containing protein [Syntrophomonas sp.]